KSAVYFSEILTVAQIQQIESTMWRQCIKRKRLGLPQA
ncbi:hypothetical protein GEW_13616, partial [Pasteurella multocida subsp. gallicida str. Anand1_poultry]